MSHYISTEGEIKYREFCNSFITRFFPAKPKWECKRLANEKWKEIRKEKDFEKKYLEVLSANRLSKPIPRILQLFAKKTSGITSQFLVFS